MNENLKSVEIYTDGACLGNPGSGGYGVILRCNGKEKELSKGFKDTTNNRMELLGVIMGLTSLKEKCNVTIYSDSQYVVFSIEKGWAKKWQANGWMKSKKEPTPNADLWKQLLNLIDEHNVKIIWVKGHTGHPENEKCDFLATQAAKNV